MSSSYCQPCDRKFTTIAGRIRHQETAVVHKNAYCNPCDRLFVHWNALSSHLQHSDAHDWCNVCDIDFDDRSELNDHIAAEHPTCCGRKFKNEMGLHEHRRQAEKHAERYCVTHKRLFDTKEDFETHLKLDAYIFRNHKLSASPDKKKAPLSRYSLRTGIITISRPGRVSAM